jgi:hypothetical protein
MADKLGVLSHADMETLLYLCNPTRSRNDLAMQVSQSIDDLAMQVSQSIVDSWGARRRAMLSERKVPELLEATPELARGPKKSLGTKHWKK